MPVEPVTAPFNVTAQEVPGGRPDSPNETEYVTGVQATETVTGPPETVTVPEEGVDR